ncbi:MAG: crossover junction endodeoxyribonuclease RuvC [Deltaproteobacteria bacterium]|nr:MAG: crossover junction endodeoxyribonuclease RuvC [Deltaproteobacteria bacterium]
MRVLGVDPGSRRCGYAVVDADARGECAYIECGVLGATAAAPLEDRLAELARDLAQVIADLKPVVVAVEDVFRGINSRSALALAHARGTVFAVAGMAGLRVHSYPPAMVKKTVAGHGRASKDQVARMVQTLVGLRTAPPADAADALAVALTHARAAGGVA